LEEASTFENQSNKFVGEEPSGIDTRSLFDWTSLAEAQLRNIIVLLTNQGDVLAQLKE